MNDGTVYIVPAAGYYGDYLNKQHLYSNYDPAKRMGVPVLSLIHIQMCIRDSPVVGIKATVYDGSYHEVDSSEMAFHIAGSLAFKEAMAKAAPVLLEPIMKVEVTMPEEYMGDVIGDINSRRGLSLIHIQMCIRDRI